MPVNSASLGSFADLATALGILLPGGGPNPSWFENPVNGGDDESGHGLKHLMADTAQRDALIRFVDLVLGPPEERRREGAHWVPLFRNGDPNVTIYAVVEPVPAENVVRLGVAAEHTTKGEAPTARTSVHVPLFRFADRDGDLGAGDAPWLLLGRPGGEIELGVDVTITTTAPPAGQASLGGVAATVRVPTHEDGDLGLAVDLRDLQLPGANAPQTFTLDADHPDELRDDLLDLVAGLVRAQADALAGDPDFRPFAGLAGMLGLRGVTALPPFPLADLPSQGIRAVVGWFEQVLLQETAKDAWLTEFAAALAQPATAVDTARDAVVISLDPLTLTIGIRVESGVGAHPVLVPWVEVALASRTGAPVTARAAVDLFRADTGTGGVVAVPDLRLEAVFGSVSTRLIGSSAGADPRVDSLRLGLALDADRHPVFVLTGHGVRLAGGPLRDVVDLSNPEAVLDAGASALTTALNNAIDGLGVEVAPLVKRLIGTAPPSGVTGLQAAALVAGPVEALRGYWERLVGAPAGMADVLGHVARLVTGTALAPLTQAGTATDPWRIELQDPLFLEAWRDGTTLRVGLSLVTEVDVLTTYTSRTAIAVEVLSLDPTASTLAFAQAARFTSTLSRTDGQTAEFGVADLGLVFDSLGIELVWTPAAGLRPQLIADRLALSVPPATSASGVGEVIDVPLPRVNGGRLVFDTPDWDQVEAAIAGLVSRLGSPEVDALVGLLGWYGGTARLSLAGLLGPDPAAAIEEWLADLVLDCGRVRAALGPVAALLSGFALSAPLGTGNAADPFRCPVAGERRAPGLRVWLDPGCAVRPEDVDVDLTAISGADAPEPETVAGTLSDAGHIASDVADLMVGRDSLGAGFQALLDRWAATDGLVGPTAVPDGVETHVLEGLDYDTLVSLGGVGALVLEVLDPVPSAVVHVGCEASWLVDKPAGTTFDLTTGSVGTVPDDAAGTWFLRLPTPAEAAAARPDLGGVGGQVTRLQAALASRTTPFVLVGYGEAGAAAVRAASAHAATTGVVTVGTPWTSLATDALRAGLGGDALRLLGRLARPGVQKAPDVVAAHETSALQRMRSLVARSLAHLEPGSLPDASLEPRRTGMAVHAVFGALTADELARGLGAFAADGLTARLEPLTESGPAPATALHAGVDLPVIDLDLGGLLVGVGAAVEMCRVGRPTTGTGIEASFVRTVVVDVHLGVHDGWLVGGPGSTSGAGDLRWMSARVEVPLTGEDGTAELVLHEATGLGIERERWVVKVDPANPTASAVVPEMRGVVSGVLARLCSASTALASLLVDLGLRRAGGLDPDALDRLLLDTVATVRARVAAAHADLAETLRDLVPGATGSGSSVMWTLGPARVGLDLATGEVTAEVDIDAAGLQPLALSVSGSPSWATARLSVGQVDGDLGGVRLVAATPAARGEDVTAALEVVVPGKPSRTVALWPAPDVAGLTEIAALAVPVVGLQALAQTLLRTASDTARPLIGEVLEVLGLLNDLGDGMRRLRLPLAAVIDPAAWVTAVARTASANPAATAVALLDALAPLVAPDRGTATGWPFVDGVLLDYSMVGERLRLTLGADLELDLDGTTVRTSLEAGALIGTGAPPQPVVELTLDIEGSGVVLTLDPSLRVSLLRAAPRAPLPIYPAGPGLGDAIGAVAESLVPRMLNELAGMATSAAGFRRDVGIVVRDLGDALVLRDGGQFSAAAISAFAADPVAALLARMPQLAGTTAVSLAEALDPSHTLVAATTATGGVTFTFGTTDAVSVTLTATGSPTIDIAAEWEIPDVGTVALESLLLTSTGVSVAARFGPFPVEAGPVTLRPLVLVRAGASSDRLLAVGVALDDTALRSVELRWALDATRPRMFAVTRNGAGATVSTVEDDAPVWLLSFAVGLVTGIVSDALGTLLDDARLQRILQGVLFETGREVDPSFAAHLLDPGALLHRLERLLWNAATDTQPLSVEIDNKLTIALTSTGSANDKQLGINVSLSSPYEFPTSGTRVALEVDSTWLQPEVTGGLTVYAVRGVRTPGAGGAPDVFSFDFEPGVTVAGLGVRFTNEAGPLLDLGIMSLDGVAVHIYAEAVTAGVGGGVQLELDGFSFAPSAGGGNNAVANGIMNDAGAQASPANRPSFSPALAVQQHPVDTGPRLSVRAGRPPGPWWLLVQRQLGPLYLERVGFDSLEADGQITRISLLFDGRVEIFGLTASVEQLSLSWLGGDLLDAGSWSVDLMGLAISADMGGVMLAGGLLKTEIEGNPGYVGMLMGRFGIYGLSVFGGYTALGNDPSFFVFGAVNGPIGGPPAFFITGLGGGLGINRKLVVPQDPAQFPTYPFIMALDPYAEVGDPMQRLRELNVFFPPELGTFWFAGGISFTCFSLVDGIAVLAVSFGNADLDINLLGLARMALPNPAAPLVSIELGLLARFSTSEGVFMIRAALTDNSWLLYEEVRLTGGFAFAVWWKGPLAGQFVLTLGGYHPDFHREGYPDVPRLGLSWQVTDDISIKGGSFFALTSEALMAGVEVTAVADFGWAWARASFGAMGLVYFDPFWFTAEAWAQISAGIEIETWFGDISISVTLGARVQVQGPEFSGRASVEVGPCTVTIPFGTQRQRPTPLLDWPGFVAKYLEESGSGRARALSAITGKGTLPPATGGSANAPTPDGSAERPFEVFAEFEITFTTTVPTVRFDVGGAAPTTVQVRRSDNAAATLGLKPMNAGDLSSTLQVRLLFFDQDQGRWVAASADLAELAETVVVSTGSFPMGVWAAPDRPLDEDPALPTGDVINAGNQARLTAVARQLNRGPEIDYYRVEAGRRPLPLQQVTGTDRTMLLSAAAGVTLPTVTSAAQALAFAEATLFAAAAPPVEGGPLPRGDRSNVARAGYRRDVAAPPLLGKLTDGLAIDNAADATVASQERPPAPAAPPLRSPRVMGYLSGGTRVASRLAATTVADRGLKRRTAPTLASVHARLGRSLPMAINVAGMPGAKVGKTFTPAALPFTSVPGAARSYRLGEGPATDRVAGLSGLGGVAPKGVRATAAAGIAKAVDETPTMVSGDIIALQLPDHAAALDQRRPLLDVHGAARLVCLRGDGVVLRDAVVTGAQPVPVGSELVVVQADGTLDALDGLAGWHSRSRIAAVGSGTGIGAGCVLDVESPTSRAGVAWTTAGELVRDADAVTTRFSSRVTCVVLVIEADDPERVGELGLELSGASRAAEPDGTQIEPGLIVNGNQSVAVYPVVPEVQDGEPGGVTVRVVAGGGWRVTGVLGSADSLGSVVAAIRRHGVAPSTGRLLAVTGPGCRPEWVEVSAVPRRKRATAKKAPAKKAGKKTTARGGRRGGQ